MQQHSLSVTTSSDQASKIADALEIAFEEEGLPVSLFEIDEAENLWTVSVYTTDDNLEFAKRECVRIVREYNADLELHHKPLPQTDWVAHTLRELHAVRAGRFLVHGSHDRDAAKTNDFAINIDAGLAFGTGHHGTTAGCLEMLEKVLKQRKFYNVLDLGTGSGVLAIGYAIATQSPVLASDIDPVAIDVTTENAKLNGVAHLINAVTATGFNHREILNDAPYDLIIANILAGPLQSMSNDFALHADHGATIILSGLLPNQKKKILASFRTQGFYFHHAHIREGWLTLVLRYQISS